MQKNENLKVLSKNGVFFHVNLFKNSFHQQGYGIPYCSPLHIASTPLMGLLIHTRLANYEGQGQEPYLDVPGIQ